MSRDFITYGFNILKDIENNLKKYINVFREHQSKDIIICNVDECHGTPFNLITSNKSTHKEFEDLIVKNDLRLIYLYGGFNPPINYKIQNVEFYNWPTFLLHLSNDDMTKKYEKSINELNINTDFNNLFICLNNVPKPHRAMMIDYLCKYDLLNKGIFSWNQLTDTFYQKYEFKYWKESITIIDNAHGIYTNHFGNVYTDDLLNYKSLINLVGETFSHIPFVSEKTFKCILLGQPFLCYGVLNQNKILKYLGFELYEEIFDYHFDSLPNIEERIECIVRSLKEISSQNFLSLYSKIKNKVEFNKRRAIEIINNDPYIPEILVEFYKKDKNKIQLNDRIPYFIDEIMKSKI